MPLYVSRRVSGAKCTSVLYLGSDTTTYRVICSMVGYLKMGPSTYATSYLCAKVSASANYFECSGMAPRARIGTTRLVSLKTQFSRVGQIVFRAGAEACLQLRRLILGSVRVCFNKGYTIVAVAGSVFGRDNSGRARYSNVTSLPHGVRNIGMNIALERQISNAFGMSLEACTPMSTSTVYTGVNNKNRTHTTNYSFSTSCTSNGGRLLRVVGARLRGT